MTDNNLNIQEDAKSDWMKLVRKHRKRQNGLPITSLNTDAGNVEHNIKMFNMMQPSEVVSADASNGNTPGNSSGCCEELNNKCVKEELSMPEQMITLHYENLPIEVITRSGNPSGHYSYSYGNWLPDDDITKEIFVDWDYSVDPIDVVEYLQDKPEIMTVLNLDYDVPDDVLQKKMDDNFDYLLKKYKDDIKDHFYDRAVEDAQENYTYEDDDYSYYEESVKTESKDIDLDDKFDMSMRTLL